MLVSHRIFLLAAGTLLLAAACQKSRPAPPLLGPETKIDVEHFLGTPLSGPTPTAPGAAAPVIDPKTCLSLKISWLLMDKFPQSAMQPLGSQARLIVAERARQPVLPTTRLTLYARLGSSGDLNRAGVRTAALENLTAVLPVGVTLSCRLADPIPVIDPTTGVPTQRYVRMEAYRPAGGKKVALALSLQDLVIPAAADEDFVVTGAGNPRQAEAAPARQLERETALLDPSDLEKPLAIVLPFTLANTATRAVALVIEVDPSPPSDQLAKDVTLAASDLTKASVDAEPIPVVSSSWSAITAAIGSLAEPERRRPALVFLANETGASILADAALVADAPVLQQMVDRIEKQSSGATNPAALGWSLDRITFDLLCDLQGQPHFPRELQAVLASHAGEAARHGSSLDEIRAGLNSRADFRARLISENQIFLEDSSPGSRIRAFDWLVQTGHAPPGYDPLGTPKDRRAALDQFIQPAAPAPAAAPASPPATLPTGGEK